MRIAISLDSGGRLTGPAAFRQAVDNLADLERAGLDLVVLGEFYTFDSVSQMGYIAAKTERLGIVAGIFPIYTRTPSMLAMTAAGLDFVSDGRFVLGLGSSGPQVVEGLHGVPFDAPIGRTREIIEICRAIWRREPLTYAGRYYQIPLPAEQGTGLGKPLKLADHPVRERIPIMVAAIGAKNVELTAELAEAWQPAFYLPEKANDVWGESLAAGRARRDPSLGELDVVAGGPLLIGADADETDRLLDQARPRMALYLGGMGARTRNFYNALGRRYGYEAEASTIQDLYLSGRKDEAAAAIPRDLLYRTSLIGSEREVAERVAAFRESGVTSLHVRPLVTEPAARRKQIETLRRIVDA